MAQLAVVMLALFGQMERTYMLERVPHARSVAVAHGRQVGRPVKVDRGKLDYARRLRDEDAMTLPEIVEQTGLTRSTLYRHLPPRPVDTHTASTIVPPDREDDVGESVDGSPPAATVEEPQPEPADDRGILQSVTWPGGYDPPCPVCRGPTSGLKERNARVGRERAVVAVAQPCGCGVDDYAAVLQAGVPHPEGCSCRFDHATFGSCLR